MFKYIMASRSLIALGKTTDERRLFFSPGRETRDLEAKGVSPTPDIPRP
jgi:hypothetical protein